MNRWMIRKVALLVSLSGGLAGALAPAAVAYAHDVSGHLREHRRGHREGLVRAALELDSLTADQRAAIEQLVRQREAAGMPVRQADAQVLALLARQVEQAKIDPQALAPSLTAEQSAAATAKAIERDSLDKLHAVLTPAQRGELVDRIQAAQGEHARENGGHEEGGRHEKDAGFGRGLDLTAEQRAQIQANLRAENHAAGSVAPEGRAVAPEGRAGEFLNAFRADSFDPSAIADAFTPGEHMERLAKAMVPVLSPSQRAAFADHLRKRASHELAGKGA